MNLPGGNRFPEAAGQQGVGRGTVAQAKRQRRPDSRRLCLNVCTDITFLRVSELERKKYPCGAGGLNCDSHRAGEWSDLTLETPPYILLLRVEHQEITNQTERVTTGSNDLATPPRKGLFSWKDTKVVDR